MSLQLNLLILLIADIYQGKLSYHLQKSIYSGSADKALGY